MNLSLVLHAEEESLPLEDAGRNDGQTNSALKGAVNLLEETDDPRIKVDAEQIRMIFIHRQNRLRQTSFRLRHLLGNSLEPKKSKET